MTLLRKNFSKKEKKESHTKKKVRQTLAATTGGGILTARNIASKKMADKISKIYEMEDNKYAKHGAKYRGELDKISEAGSRIYQHIDKTSKNPFEKLGSMRNLTTIETELYKDVYNRWGKSAELTDKASKRLRKSAIKKGMRNFYLGSAGSAALGIGAGLAVNRALKKKNIKDNKK